MSKPSLNTPQADAEIVTAGQPSTRLLQALTQIGEHITDEQIEQAYTNAESRRTAWQSAAIETGLLLLAKRQTLKHGQWGKVIAAYAAKLATRCQFDAATSARSLRNYTLIAQHLLADIEQGRLEGTLQAPDESAPLAVEEVATLATLPHSRRMAVTEAITHWVRGRSLRQMLADLRRADQAAEREEIADAERAPLPPLQKTAAQHRLEDEAQSTAPESIRGDEQQLELWTDFTRPLHLLDDLLNDDDVAARSKKDLWRGIVAKLQDQLRLAKSRLENLAD